MKRPSWFHLKLRGKSLGFTLFSLNSWILSYK